MKTGESPPVPWVFLAVLLVCTRGACAALPSAAFPELLTVPRPDLGRTEPAVRLALEKIRAALDARAADPGTPTGALAEAFANAGMQYQAHLLLVPAAACYRNARRLAPGDYRWPYYLGYLEQQDSRLEQAAAAYRETLRLQPGFAVARLRLGRIELELGRLDKAGPLLQAAVQDPGLRGAALFELGKLAYAKRDFAMAAARLREALAAAPDASRIHYTLALACRALGDTEAARHHLALRGDREPAFPDPLVDVIATLSSGQRMLFHSGMSAAFRDDYAEAARLFRAGLDLDPDNLDARVSLARFLYLSGETDSARAQLEAVLQRAPRHTLARFLLGVLLDARGEATHAIEQLRRALDADPRHAGAHYCLAGALMRRGEPAAAADHYRRSLEQEPDNVSAWLWRVLASIQAGTPHARLRRLLEEGLARHPQEGALGYFLAALLAASPDDRVRDGARALDLAQELYARHPSPEHAELVAMAHAELGDFAAAVAQQQAALDSALSRFRMDLVPQIEANLARFRAGEPCRVPWSEEGVMYAAPVGNAQKTFGGYPPEAPF